MKPDLDTYFHQVFDRDLRHSEISLTLYTCSHILPSMQAEAAEKLDERLSPIAVDLQPKSAGIERKG